MYDLVFLPMRMQPMHIGHLDLLIESSKLARKCIVLIFVSKSLDMNNPLTGERRREILSKTCEIEGLKNVEIIVMPHFENSVDRFKFVKYHVPLTEESLVVSGNDFIIDSFSGMGFKVMRPEDILGELIDVSGKKVRELIRGEKEFKHHLSSGTLHYLKDLDFFA